LTGADWPINGVTNERLKTSSQKKPRKIWKFFTAIPQFEKILLFRFARCPPFLNFPDRQASRPRITG